MDKYNLMLNEMIHNHGIDSQHPWFYESIRAVKCIEEFWEENEDIKKVLILAEKRGDFENFRIHIPLNITYELILYDNTTLFSLEKSILDIEENAFKNSDRILLITYKDHIRVSSELQRLKVNVIDIYDYFIEKDLDISHEYYLVEDEEMFNMSGETVKDTFFQNTYNTLFYHKRKYSLASTDKLRFYYLEKVIFDYYYIRDFADGEKYVNKYITMRPEIREKYGRFLKEIRAMLETMKEDICKKGKKDIVLYWIDALSYGEDRSLRYLHSLDSQCMVLTKAFTTIDTTSGAASALFRQEMPLESRRFRTKKVIEESQIFDALMENGWDFKYYGIGGIFSDSKLKVVKKEHLGMVSTTNYWKMLCDMTVDIKPTFRIVHCMGCHTPFLSGDLEGELYLPAHGFFCKKNDETADLVYKQRSYAMQFEDRQLEYYDGLIQPKAAIYFSDHGCHSFAGNNLAVLYHTMFKIKSELVGTGKDNRIFSIINFIKLIKFLINPEINKFEDIFSEYAKIQGLPYYNKTYVKQAYRKIHYNESSMLGYQGIIRGNAAYFLLGCGIDLCYELRDDKAYLMGYERSKELRMQFKKMAGEYAFDIKGDELFRYSRILIPVYENAKSRIQPENAQKECRGMCIKLLNEIPESEKIAIRGGGEDTVMFLDCLPAEQRKRIKYIVDSDSNCAAFNWDIPVIRPEEVETIGRVCVIIISSNHRAAMMEELNDRRNIRAIDVYEYLMEHGINMERNLSDILYGKRLVYIEEDFPKINWDNV